MTKTLILLAAALPAFAQQAFDFKSLDKLGVNAKESTNITLDGNTLKLASGFLSKDKDSDALRGLVNGLKSVYVRSYEFDGAGKYNESDLRPLRDYLSGSQWSKIVDVKSAKETSEVYFRALPDNKVGGIAIITAEPLEVTVVFIDGVINAGDVSKLGGNLGIPDMTFMNDGKKTKPAEKKE